MSKASNGSYRTVQRTNALPDVEILRGRIASDSAGGGFFTQYGIAAGEGPMSCHYRGKRHQLVGRYVMLVEPGDFVPTAACGGDVQFQAWYFSPEEMRRVAAEHGLSGKPHFVKGLIYDPRIHSLVTHTAAVLSRACDALDQQQAQTMLLDSVLAEYVRGGGTIRDVIAHRAVQRMRDLLNEGYDQPLTLETLAAHAHLNKFHALRAFKRVLGVTPHDYQRRLRVGKAQEMLRAGYSSVDVAHALSFCDQSHLVRTFRHFVCMTPGQYQLGV